MCALRCALRGLRVRLRCANPRAPHGIGVGIGRHRRERGWWCVVRRGAVLESDDKGW